jgi:protein gp37
MTKIEWTDRTWNPVVGCSPASAGCRNCYAARLATRFATSRKEYTGIACRGKWTGEVRFIAERLEMPFRTRGGRVFAASMGDVFHEQLDARDILAILGAIAANPQATFQLVTKRPQRMAAIIDGLSGHPDPCKTIAIAASQTMGREVRQATSWPLPNLWLGATLEHARYADRIASLIAAPAIVHFLSCEPLLGSLADIPLDDIEWIIAGGESGWGARPTHPDWIRELRDRSRRHGLPYFFKQWGEWGTARRDGVKSMTVRHGNGKPDATMYRSGKKTNGKALDGETWLNFPEVAS